MTDRAEQMRRAAAVRAAILAHLKAHTTNPEHPGISVHQLMQDLPIIGTEGYNTEQTGNLLDRALRSNLVAADKKGMLNLYRIGKLGAKGLAKAKKVLEREPRTIGSAPAPCANSTIPKEVELVIAGVTFIISRNESTGRPRITIEA